jgi:hypothetical protein
MEFAAIKPALRHTDRLCFVDVQTQTRLQPIVDEAFRMRRVALGEQRGVDLVYTLHDACQNQPEGICFGTNRSWRAHRDAVGIALGHGGTHAYNDVGWKPGHGLGRMYLAFDPGNDGSVAARMENIAAMAHEIGETLYHFDISPGPANYAAGHVIVCDQSSLILPRTYQLIQNRDWSTNTNDTMLPSTSLCIQRTWQTLTGSMNSSMMPGNRRARKIPRARRP